MYVCLKKYLFYLLLNLLILIFVASVIILGKGTGELIIYYLVFPGYVMRYKIKMTIRMINTTVLIYARGARKTEFSLIFVGNDVLR